MKRVVFSPEIRQGMLRLLEIWHVMNIFCEEYTERISTIRESMSGSRSGFCSIVSLTTMVDHVSDCICQMEDLHEQKEIAQSFIGIMNDAWQKLTERDKVILDAYRRDSEIGERQRRICERYSISATRAHNCRDAALKHLWIGLHEISSEAYQFLCDLGYRWGILEYCSQGQELRLLREYETNKIQEMVINTGIPVLQKENTIGEGITHVCFELCHGIWPNGFNIKLISQKRDHQIERILEDALVRCRCIFQIFRFRQQGAGNPYRVEYVFPFENREINAGKCWQTKRNANWMVNEL